MDPRQPIRVPITQTYLSIRASSCSRSLRPSHTSALRYTTSSTKPSSPAAPSPASSRSSHGKCHRTSATSRPSSHKRTFLACGRRASSTAGTPPRLRTMSRRHQAPVALAASHSKNVNSRRQYKPGVRSLRCSARRGSRSWSRQVALAVLCTENQHSCANCRPRRRKPPRSSRQLRHSKRPVDCRESRRRAGKGKRCG